MPSAFFVPNENDIKHVVSFEAAPGTYEIETDDPWADEDWPTPNTHTIRSPNRLSKITLPLGATVTVQVVGPEFRPGDVVEFTDRNNVLLRRNVEVGRAWVSDGRSEFSDETVRRVIREGRAKLIHRGPKEANNG